MVDGGGVVGGVGGALVGEAAGEDLLGGPGVDGVGGGFDFEHAVGDVLGDALLGQAGAAGGAFELAEFAAAFVDGDGPGFRVELGLDGLVFVFAGDLADPAAGTVADDDDFELGGCAGRRRRSRSVLRRVQR